MRGWGSALATSRLDKGFSGDGGYPCLLDCTDQFNDNSDNPTGQFLARAFQNLLVDADQESLDIQPVVLWEIIRPTPTPAGLAMVWLF